MTEPRIRYWRHVTSTGVTATCDDDACGKHTDSRFYIDTEGWVEVTVTPVVTGDVIERTARALHAWDVEGGPCEGPWESLTPEQHEVWLSGARALADAGLLAGSRTVTPEQREAAEAVLTTSPHMLLLSPGTIAKIVDTVLTAVGLTVEEGS